LTSITLQSTIRNFSQHFLRVRADEFTKNILAALEQLGASAETLVFEK
jgi:hypothetical protein